MVEFYFFACTCPDLSTPFVEEAMFLLHFMLLPPFVACYLTIETWVYFLALYSFPLIYMSLLRPIPDYFDYNGLCIRYCDPSYFVLLSQNCYGCLESFMVPYKFLKCLFCICEICHWYFNRDCIESADRFGLYGHFHDVNSSNL